MTEVVIRQLSEEDVKAARELPLFEVAHHGQHQQAQLASLNFARIKEHYHGQSQVLLLTMFGLLDLAEWNALLAKSKSDADITELCGNHQTHSQHFDDQASMEAMSV